MNTGLRLLAALASSALLTVTAVSVATAAEDKPITVEANHMSSVEKESTVIFTGEVDARQDNVRIRCDKMIVYYTEKAKVEADAAVKQKVEKLVCNENVQVTRDEWLGTSKDMVYLSQERQFILIGDAKAYQGQNMVAGDKIIYYLDQGRSEVVSERTSATIGAKDGKAKDKGRVKMTILDQ
jgi:lipopolysaccharide export system protein LptA